MGKSVNININININQKRFSMGDNLTAVFRNTFRGLQNNVLSK